VSRPLAQHCELGVWGAFDADSFGDVLAGRIVERELRRRLSSGTVRVFAPIGGQRAVPRDPGEPPEPLGVWTDERCAELAADLDAVVIEAGDLTALGPAAVARRYPGHEPDDPVLLEPARWLVGGLGAHAQDGCPVIWQDAGVVGLPGHDLEQLPTALQNPAIVAVRDDASAKVLADAGVTREVLVVPPTALLVTRMFPSDLLRQRLDYLRLMGWYPPDGAAIVVQGGAAMAERIDDVAEALSAIVASRPGTSMVVIETEPADASLADGLAERLPELVRRIPADAGVEDLCAAIAMADAFVGDSHAANVVACAYHRPRLAIDLTGDPALEGFVQLIGEGETRVVEVDRLVAAFDAASQPASATAVAMLEHRIDHHFDRVVELAEAAAPRRAAVRDDAARRVTELEERLERLQRAHQVRSRRLVDERVAFGDQVRAVALENLTLRNELDEARRRADEADEAASRDASYAADARRQRDDALAELDRMRRTRTFRYTESMRRVYGDVRRRWP
jgi:hypothetical protein